MYSISELAQLADVTPRTIRFYVQQDLIPKPAGIGRGSHYTPEHLARLQEVKMRQRAGASLDSIRKKIVGTFYEVPGGTATGRAAFPGVFPPEADGSTGRSRRPFGGSKRVSDGRSSHRKAFAETTALSAEPQSLPFGLSYIRHPLLPGYELHVDEGAVALDAEDLAALTDHLRMLMNAKKALLGRGQASTP